MAPYHALAQLEYLPDNTTLLIGSVADQAALYGCLTKLRDGGVPLLGVEQIKSIRQRRKNHEPK